MDIFEQYGFYALHFDGLNTIASQRSLTEKEKNFYDAFSDMLHENKTESDMKKAWRKWMEVVK